MEKCERYDTLSPVERELYERSSEAARFEFLNIKVAGRSEGVHAGAIRE